LFMGNPTIIKAQISTLKSDPLISPSYASLIVDLALKYIKENFGFEGVARSLDELEDFLLKIADDYPVEEAVVYGIYKGESMLAGAVGPICRRFGKEAPKKLVQSLEATNVLKESRGLYDCLSKYKDILVKIGFIKNEDLVLEDLGDEVLVKLGGRCTYLNVCTQLNKEEVRDVYGLMPCGRLIALAGIAEASLNKIFDAKLVSYNPPNCSGKIFEYKK